MSLDVLRRAFPQWTDVAAFALVAATALAGPAVLPQLPAEMIVGWHVGLDGRVSLTHGPRILGLVVLPATSAGFFLALRAVRSVVTLDSVAERRAYDAATLLLLGGLCAAQVSLIAANL